MTVLEIENLCTQFDTERGIVEAVADVDLAIEPGEIVGLVGESGSGKTVLADSIMKLVDSPGEIVSGDIRLHGDSLVEKTETEMSSIRGNKISMIFQDPMNSLNPTLRVGEQIAETVRLHQEVSESVSLPAEFKRKLLGASENTESWRRAIEMLESVQIPEASIRAADYPHQFSGGMRQRAMIAMALSCEPDVLVADEPTTALDVTVQAQILNELQNLRSTFDTSILIITHNLAVVAEVCDWVNVMYAGEIVERAETDELFENPQHPYTQNLLKSIPKLTDHSEGLEGIPGSVPDLIEIPQACHFAPRCPEATEECYDVKPYFRPVGCRSHEVACLYRGSEEEQP